MPFYQRIQRKSVMYIIYESGISEVSYRTVVIGIQKKESNDKVKK